LTGELLSNFESEIESVTLVPSDGGRFEVIVNAKLVYSKLHTGRHADAGEVVDLTRKMMEDI
jgi:selenoprotein W-related protein